MSSLSLAEPKETYQAALLPSQWVEVLVDCPISSSSRSTQNNHTEPELEDQEDSDISQDSDKAYTYKVPENLTVKKGNIVLVPFGKGNQERSGIVLKISYKSPENLSPDKIKNIKAVLSNNFLTDIYWQLLERISQYYCTEMYKVFRAVLPPGIFPYPQTRIRLCLDKLPHGYEVFCSQNAQGIIGFLQTSKADDYSYSFNHIKKKIKQYIKEKPKRQLIEKINTFSVIALNTNASLIILFYYLIIFQVQKLGSSSPKKFYLEREINELLKRGWIKKYTKVAGEVKPKKQQVISLIGNRLSSELSKRQREILYVLGKVGGEIAVSEFLRMAKTDLATLKRLETKSYVVIEERENPRMNRGIEQEQDEKKSLTSAQKTALETINNTQQFAEILLHGVTGSGKTEVYLQAIAPILEQGKSALILVPEIGLTPQLTDRFRARFGQQICVYHSGLSDGERYDTWRQMLQGTPQVVIGTRSAIFAPLPNLGMIILDEEHDSSFKQTDKPPTYHARTVAQWRAELEDCPLILGSATPSLETFLKNKLKSSDSSVNLYLSLPERIQQRPLPPVQIIDMRQELKRGNRSIFSLSLQNALKQLKEEGKQGILFINRRGYSTFVSCRTCGYVMECPHCDVSLSYHYTHEGATELLRCHYCNYTALQPPHCPDCSSPYFKFFGSGTQKVTQELARQFPSLRCIRFDSDTTKKKDAHRQLLSQFARGEADILVGTQMLTKGLDLAQVTLVGVLAADGLLYHSDYRAAERGFQTLTQVAGRAGRGDDPGQVIIQTYNPEHPVIQAVQTHDYQGFVDYELPKRQELDYPPYGSLILLKFSGLEASEVQATTEKLAETCLSLVGEDCEILGPAPAPIMRVANRYRWHIVLKFANSEDFQRPNLEFLRNLCPDGVKMTIDVDPLSIA